MKRQAYQEATNSFNKGVLEFINRKASEEGLLKEVRKTIIAHGPQLTHTDIHGVARPSELKEMRNKLSVQAETLAWGDVVNFRAEIQKAVETLRSSITARLFEVAAEAADEAGNSIAIPGDSFTKEGILTLLDRIQISFDSDGSPIMPKIIVHPSKAPDLEKLLDDKVVKFRMDNKYWAALLDKHRI